MKGKPGEPVLISWDDARTLFHEFGHALHGLASDVTYPSLSGTEVARDFVEFPSQLLEHWLETPEVLYPLRAALPDRRADPGRDRRQAPRRGHLQPGLRHRGVPGQRARRPEAAPRGGGDRIDPRTFERETLAALGMPAEIVMRHRTAQFSHVFSSDGYAAGYYSYLWADTLTADAFEAFNEAEGPYDHAVAERLRKHVFSAGNTVDPADAYRAFRGKDAGIGALMRKRGFPSHA